MQNISILIIEDNDDDAVLLVKALRRGGLNIDYEVVDASQSLKSSLERDWDIIFCDYSMPKLTGLEALDIVREVDSDIPFIFVSGTIGEDVAVESLRRGAQDYIMKDNLKRLVSATKRELQDRQIRKERRNAESQLYFLTHFDSLTHLPNRFNFITQLDQAIKEHSESSIAIFYVDLDRFRTINDSIGYEAGNIVLGKVAERLSNCVGQRGVVARMASDEFAIFLYHMADDGAIENFSQTLLYTLGIPFNVYELSQFFSASIGVAVYPGHGTSATRLIGNADVATYRAKDDGGRCYRVYRPDMSVHLEERLAMERSMRFALENNDFFLEYQPQYDLGSNRITGVEALVRWQHKEKGRVNPGEFIPLAEDTGFILLLGDWILGEVCKQIIAWSDLIDSKFRVAVNISMRQLNDYRLPDRISAILSRYEIDPGMLEVEVTESSLIKNVSDAIAILGAIKKSGVSVALDDFGTGYSSLSHLKLFRPDFLKIDQSFIREIPDNENDMSIVSAIIAMAKKLSLRTIAEGVETQEQMDFVRAQGCDIVQGYLMSRPVSVAKLTQMLEKQNTES